MHACQSLMSTGLVQSVSSQLPASVDLHHGTASSRSAITRCWVSRLRYQGRPALIPLSSSSGVDLGTDIYLRSTADPEDGFHLSPWHCSFFAFLCPHNQTRKVPCPLPPLIPHSRAFCLSSLCIYPCRRRSADFHSSSRLLPWETTAPYHPDGHLNFHDEPVEDADFTGFAGPSGTGSYCTW
jgi:hypothetical protein